jgi:hypothetical protein
MTGPTTMRVCPLMVEQCETYDTSTSLQPPRAPFVRCQLRPVASRGTLRRGGRLDAYLLETLREDVRMAGDGSQLIVDFVNQPTAEEMQQVVPALLSLAARGVTVTIACRDICDTGHATVVRFTAGDGPESERDVAATRAP